MSKPSTTLEFIDALKAQKGFTSDYQLWKFLGWKQTTLSSYRTSRTAMARDHALRIADELGLSREYVIACVELERETSAPVRLVWESIAHRFRDAAASILLGLVAAAGFTHPAEAAAKKTISAESSAISPPIHYTCLRAWRFLRRWLAVSGLVLLAGCATHPATDAEIAELAAMRPQAARGLVHVKRTALCARDGRGVIHCDL